MTMRTTSDFDAWMHTQQTRIEQALQQWLCYDQAQILQVANITSDVSWDVPTQSRLNHLQETMRYAVLDGGKRLRPLLVIATFETLQQSIKENAYNTPLTKDFSQKNEQNRHSITQNTLQGLLRAACAVELIHAYSLVHDDMPCMDNDILRRGKPTVHMKYGQAMALLAGDSLQALAFEILTPFDNSLEPVLQAKLCALLARASGFEGMAGGQAIDLLSVGDMLSAQSLQLMHRLKTGALLQCSILMGLEVSLSDIKKQNLFNDATGEKEKMIRQALKTYGAAIGLAFQVVDDILDVTANTDALGKTTGKDAQAGKPTYVSLLGLPQAQALARTLQEKALQALQQSQLPDTTLLTSLARMVIERNH